MWIYDYYLKNGVRKQFYTDEPGLPREVAAFCDRNKGQIEDSFCDHFPCTIAEFTNGKCIDKEIIVCKGM